MRQHRDPFKGRTKSGSSGPGFLLTKQKKTGRILIAWAKETKRQKKEKFSAVRMVKQGPKRNRKEKNKREFVFRFSR